MLVVDDLLKYWIEIIGLKNRIYEFSYDIQNSFFRNFEGSMIEKGSLNCLLELNKTDSFINIRFRIKGTIDLTCDRSLDHFDYPVKVDKNILFKFGEEDREIDEAIEMISRNRQGINVGQYIYELVSMEIPMKKLHPRYSGENEEEWEEKLVYSSSEEKEKEEEGDGSSEDTTDPRWEILKKLRNHLN